MKKVLKELSPNIKRLTKTRVNLVSVYSNRQGVVLAAQQFESNKSRELKVGQIILEALQLEGVVFTLDALHCQKNY